MTSRRTTTTITYAALGAALVATTLLPKTLTIPPSFAGVEPDEIVLNGLVRDFYSSHADFDVIPADGLGHYAGTVNTWLSGDRRPLFLDDGVRVDAQWTNLSSRNIAPHLSGQRGRLGRETLGFRVDGEIRLGKDTYVDAFNSNYGPYGLMGNYGASARVTSNTVAKHKVKIEDKAMIRGDVFVGLGGAPMQVITGKGTITGTIGTLDEPNEMPDIDPPTDLDTFQPLLEINGPATLTGDTTPDDDTDDPALHVGDLKLEPGAVLTVAGDLRILCDGAVSIRKAEIVLLPGANLSFFVNGSAVKIRDESLINVDPGDTTLVTFNVLGGGDVDIEKRSHVYATVVAPNRRLHVKSEAHFYGGFIGASVRIENKGTGVHIDQGNAKTGPANFALSARDKIEIEDSTLDSFDSNEGVYGGSNKSSVALISVNSTENDRIKLKKSTVKGDVLVGPYGNPNSVIDLDDKSSIDGMQGTLATPVAIPVVAPPSVGVSQNDVEYKNGVFTLASDMRCKKLKLDKATLKISGHITIRCDDKIEMKHHSRIELNPDSSLILYVKKDLQLDTHCKINENGNPQLVSIRRTSVGQKGKIELKKHSQICAWVQGAKTELKVEDQSTFTGSFVGEKVKISKSKMHVDMAYLTTCLPINDAPGSAGPGGDGGVTSRDTFREWWSNQLGMNQATGHSITLTRAGDGAYEYVSEDFHPIDLKLLGNEGKAHNHHFTYIVAAEFTYTKCDEQFVEFRGGDGAWLFLNNQLALDLGGMGNDATDQHIALDRLGLEDGDRYDFRLYYAQRREPTSVFALRTNLELSSRRFVPSVTAVFD